MAFGFVLLTQFTNCDVSSTSNGIFEALNSTCKTDETGFNPCTTQDPNMVELRVNSGTLVYILSGSTCIDIAGDCNEGGYILGNAMSKNVIEYYLYQGAILLSSSASDASSTVIDTTTTCVNGRFKITVVFPNGGTPAAQTGCGALGGAVANVDYTLKLQILTYDNQGRQNTPNLVSDTRTLTIRAIP